MRSHYLFVPALVVSGIASLGCSDTELPVGPRGCADGDQPASEPGKIAFITILSPFNFQPSN